MIKKVFLEREVETTLIWCGAMGFTVALFCIYRLVFPLDAMPALFMWLGLIFGLCEIAFVIRSVYFEKPPAPVGDASRRSA